MFFWKAGFIDNHGKTEKCTWYRSSTTPHRDITEVRRAIFESVRSTRRWLYLHLKRSGMCN
jgi:hypothetical protein